MSQSSTTEVNYWPGYVDALVNVVLNLLFLTGVFTIGLVTLNFEALFTQQKMNLLKIDAINNIHDEAKKQAKAKEFLNALPKVKEPIIFQKQNLELPRIYEIRVTPSPPIKATTILATEVSSAIEPGTPVNFPNKNSIDKTLQIMFDGLSMYRINFEINQYAFDNPWKLPIPSKELLETQHSWLLISFCDTSNSRLTKEAFARLVFVRKSMIEAGMSPNQIQIRVLSESNEINNQSDIERTVFLIKKLT